MRVEASDLPGDADTIAIGFFTDEGPSAGETMDRALAALIETGEAQARLGHVSVTRDQSDHRFLLIGLGDRRSFAAERARVAAAAAHARAAELSARTLYWAVPRGFGADIAAGLVEGTLLHGYGFERYLPARERAAVERLIVGADSDVSDAVRRATIVSRAQNRARDLGNTPANDLTPSALADYARGVAQRSERLSVEVLDDAEIREAGMGAFAAVSQGSAEEARLITLSYQGPEARGPLIGLLGKAVTFDSGGLALKGRETMHEMKFDMAGGAAVIEAISAVAELEAPVRLLGIIGATENLPSGTAVRPGDIVRALDGTTIEINNPDAEGRLVLADCLCFARSLGAERLVDVATLTGAVQTALGSVYAGVMSNDDAWVALVRACGERSGERVWQLPLDPAYAQMIKGRYAQLTNRAERREAQAITAAELLHRFAGSVPWAHLDIAGTAFDVPSSYLRGKGATGFGVRLLVELALAAGADLA